MRWVVPFLLVFSSQAATYWVKTNGNDGLDGSSLANAWLTIQKAADTMVAGDLARIQPGIYARHITNSTDGTAGSPITFMGDGGEVLIFGRWLINGANYTRLVSLSITHSNSPATGFPGVWIQSSTGVECRDVDVFEVDEECFDLRGVKDLRICGGRHYSPGWPTQPTPQKGIYVVTGAGGTSTNITIEYAQASKCGDYFNPYGEWFTMRNCILGPDYVGSADHIDGIQGNGSTSYVLCEAVTHWERGTSDNHLWWSEIAGNTNHIFRGMVVLKSTGQAGVSGGSGRVHFYHNLEYNNDDVRDLGSSLLVWSSGSTNLVKNNIWYRCRDSGESIYGFSGAGTAIHDFSLFFLTGDADDDDGESVTYTNQPLFVDTNIYDMAIAVDSFYATNNGGPIVYAVNDGSSSTSLIVDHGTAFRTNDVITITNQNPVRIEAISGNAYTLEEARTWNSGDPIYWGWSSTPTMGAYPYTTNTYILAGTYTTNGANVYTVTPNNTNNVRFVEFWEDGLPTDDWVPPWQYTSSGNAVTIRLRPLYASTNLFAEATYESGGESATNAHAVQLRGTQTWRGNVRFQ